ncbi:hypothetical protein HGRIS_000087 [Hohenbuehelia grisea]|uniref:Glutathione S-transferase n=1 Tax=Hohenbuehelia grisea TaxID=104357 RepID=A0ABR3JQT0_9AGAR
MSERLVLYAAKFSPYVESVELALAVVNAKYTTHDISLDDKPAWYTEKINPAGLVPAITYGGPVGSPENPSPEAFKLAESTVILTFIADLYPNSSLLPQDPKLRANAHFFIYQIVDKIVPTFREILIKQLPAERLLQAFEEVQRWMHPDHTKLIVGSDLTIADASFIPLAWRFEVLMKHDIGSYPAGEGIKAYKTYADDPKFARLRAYLAVVKARPDFQLFNDEAGLVKHSSRVNVLRAATV